jgi:hypothetical protein
VGLIPLSGNIADCYPLIICKPKVDALGLPYEKELKTSGAYNPKGQKALAGRFRFRGPPPWRGRKQRTV